MRLLVGLLVFSRSILVGAGVSRDSGQFDDYFLFSRLFTEAFS